MQSIFRYIFLIVICQKLKTVPITSLRCERKKVGIEEGWGGECIDKFPPSTFFKMFVEGYKEQAKAEMQQWYYERFWTNGLHRVHKSDGGMYMGSLYRLVKETHSAQGIEVYDNLENANEQTIHQAIKKMVDRRFILVKSIKEKGYVICAQNICATKQGNHYMLLDGHHRACALYACGIKYVPTVVASPAILRVINKLGCLSYR